MLSRDNMNVEVEEALPPAPRSVRRKLGSGCGLWFIRLFILPHTIAGIFLIVSIPFGWYVEHFGTPVTATVDRRETQPTKKGGKLYQLYYHYDFGGRRFEGSESVSEEQYNQAGGVDAGGSTGLTPGSSTAITTRPSSSKSAGTGVQFEGRAVAVLPGHPYFRAPSEWGGWSLLPMLGFALFWNGILSFFLYAIWILPLRQRLLVKRGEVATAAITSRKIHRGKGTTYTLMYRFTAEGGGEYTGACNVTKSDYENIPDGAPVLVVYKPTNPRHNLAYRFSDFIAGPGGGTWSWSNATVSGVVSRPSPSPVRTATRSR
jgi:hypothetical protein